MGWLDSVGEFLGSKRGVALIAITTLTSTFVKMIDAALPQLVRPIVIFFLALCVLSISWIIYAKVSGKTRSQDAERAYHYSSERYGVGYRRLEVECTIRPDGSARVQRRVEVEAFSEIRQLDTFLLIPELPPSGEEWNIDPVQVRSLSPEYNVSRRTFGQQGRLSALIMIAPQLGAGEQFTYELTEQLPAGLYAIDLAEEKLAKRQPYDYFGWSINRPTRKLSLKVYFPEEIKPVYDSEVRYASAAPGIPSESFHLEERKRFAKPNLIGPQGGRYVLTLEVDYPMIGLIYILRWQPLKTTPKQMPR